jgi:putative aminopeptidase FrvX
LKKISLQFNLHAGYGEDGAEMQKAFTGTPSVNMTVPVRYLPTHYDVIDRGNFDHLVGLVTVLVHDSTSEKINQIKQF